MNNIPKHILALLTALLLAPPVALGAAVPPPADLPHPLAAKAAASCISKAAAAETSAGWKKFEGNPVMGGKYGTCFDICVLQRRRDVPHVALLAAQAERRLGREQGRHPLERTAADRPRPTKGDRLGRRHQPPRACSNATDGYHMWYTGQAKGHSWIGYATSPDGRTWKRMSDKPVLSFDQPWEKSTAVMCPHGRSGTRQGEAFPHVVFRRRAERAERHRLRHQPRRPGLDEVRKRTRSSAPKPKNPWEKHKVTGLPGAETRRLARDVLHRIPRRGDTPRSASPAARTASPAGNATRPIRSSARARTNGTTTPATSRTPFSTARNGCSGTTAGTATGTDRRCLPRGRGPRVRSLTAKRIAPASLAPPPTRDAR